MLSYTAAGIVDGLYEVDETFGMDGFEVDKANFDAFLRECGFNTADIESLGYEEIVRQINAR